MRVNRLAGWFVVLVAAFCSAGLRAQQLPGAGGFAAGPGAEGHGWLVVGPADGPKLVHVPPRGTVDVGGGRQMSAGGGAVRLAARLEAMPEGVAASGRSAYLIFPPGPGGRRLVLRVSVRPAPVGNLWDIDQQERLDAMPPLEAQGRLDGFVATPLGLAALVARGSEEQSLWVLRPGGWMRASLPPGARTGESQLVAMPGGLGLVSHRNGETSLWEGRESGGDGGAAPDIGWSAHTIAAGAGWEVDRPRQVFWTGGGLVYGARTDDGLEVREAASSGDRLLAVLRGVGERFAIAGLPQSGRVIVVWARGGRSGGQTAAAGSGDSAYEVREVSVYTGRVLYQGAPTEPWPFSLLEFRLLAVLLVAIVVGVLLFVLRPEQGDGTVLLPQGTALAEPWRRAVAAAIDMAFAWLVVAGSMGVSIESLFVPVFGARLVPVLVTVLAFGCLHCTLGEWLFGRSLGKAIAGCRVVIVGRSGDPQPGNAGPAAPEFRAAVVRNLIRWGLPPLGLAGLASTGGRHRGDVLAGTAVVVAVDPEVDAQE